MAETLKGGGIRVTGVKAGETTLVLTAGTVTARVPVTVLENWAAPILDVLPVTVNGVTYTRVDAGIRMTGTSTSTSPGEPNAPISLPAGRIRLTVVPSGVGVKVEPKGSGTGVLDTRAGLLEADLTAGQYTFRLFASTNKPLDVTFLPVLETVTTS